MWPNCLFKKIDHFTHKIDEDESHIGRAEEISFQILHNVFISFTLDEFFLLEESILEFSVFLSISFDDLAKYSQAQSRDSQSNRDKGQQRVIVSSKLSQPASKQATR